MKPMKQQCYLYNVWFTWLGIPVLAILMGVFAGWWAFPLILVIGIIAQFVYIRIFPKLSRSLGYGNVEDVTVEPPKQPIALPKVTLYAANVCPFCPIVRHRLVDLQRTMRFELSEVDVTFQPRLIRDKGFKSVPVVETDGRRSIGNATTAQLVSFLTNTK